MIGVLLSKVFYQGIPLIKYMQPVKSVWLTSEGRQQSLSRYHHVK